MHLSSMFFPYLLSQMQKHAHPLQICKIRDIYGSPVDHEGTMGRSICGQARSLHYVSSRLGHGHNLGETSCDSTCVSSVSTWSTANKPQASATQTASEQPKVNSPSQVQTGLCCSLLKADESQWTSLDRWDTLCQSLCSHQGLLV